MKLKSFLISLAAVSLVPLLTTEPAQAGTAAYYSECSFIDKGPDSGGNVIEMPCYIVEGSNMNGAFFNILWRDGTYTVMSGNARTGERVGSFSSLVYRGLYENPEGDLIYIDDLEYTNDRFDVTQDGIANRVWRQ